MILKHYLITMGVLAGAFGMSVQPAVAVNWGDCSVEAGLTTIVDTKSSVTVPPASTIIDTTQAFVLAQATGDVTTHQTDDHFVTAEIDGSGNVVFDRAGTTGDAEISYHIVQCGGGDKIKVQRGTIALGSGATSATGALTGSVDTSRSLVLATIRSNAGSTFDAESMVTAALQDASTVVVQRATAALSTLGVHYQVIEFTAAANVQLQTAETTLSTGVASATVTLTTAAATDRSWVYCTYDATDNGLQQTAVACELTDASTVTLYRSAASSYTNRVRVYVVTWPGNTVTVQSGSDAFDSTAADNTAVDHTITLSTAITDGLSFPYVTNTTTGTSTEYPRNRWLAGLPTSTSLLLRFYRSDPSGDSDATIFYWQIINFPPPYEASGWGWIGNSTTTAVDGTVLISFSCDSITVDITWTDCGDGTSGTRYDYGVQLERGGCGDICDVSGQAWVGDYTTGETTPHTIGMIDFDTDVTSGPPATLGDDVNTPEDDTLDAHWNEETGEVYGWARFRALEEYEDSLGGTANDWGWIKLRGTESSGGTEYGVAFDADALEFSGWSWNDNGSDPSTGLEEDGSGFGWVKFDLDTSGTVAAAWLRTTQADVYSQQGFYLNTNAPTGEYSATYLIISGGDATTINNFDTQLGTTITDEDLGGIPTDNAAQVYRGTLGSLYLNELIDQADHADTDGACDDTLFTGATNPLGGDIFYCDGDLTISNNLTFYNATGSGLGNGTVIVTGDLVIEDNLNYFNTTIDQHINNLASIAWIVQGSVLIDPIVTQVVGAFIVLGDSDATTTSDCHFTTGNSTLPLEVQGLVMACAFDLERQSLGSTPDPEPGEDFRYDGRVFANPPPGLDDFASLIPEFVL